MKKILIAIGMVTLLSGCMVTPAPYYGGYSRPVMVAPAPYYGGYGYGPSFSIGGGGYWGHGSGWGHHEGWGRR